MSHVFPLEGSGHHRKMARRTSPPQKGPGNRWFRFSLSGTNGRHQAATLPSCVSWVMKPNWAPPWSKWKWWWKYWKGLDVWCLWHILVLWYGIRKSYLLIDQERGGTCDAKINGEFYRTPNLAITSHPTKASCQVRSHWAADSSRLFLQKRHLALPGLDIVTSWIGRARRASATLR